MKDNKDAMAVRVDFEFVPMHPVMPEGSPSNENVVHCPLAKQKKGKILTSVLLTVLV